MELDEKKLLLSLIKTISGSWISASQFERLASEMNISEGAETIYFLTGIQNILRELPFKVYLDDATRTAVIDAAQTALDTAIEKEEANSPLTSTEERHELGQSGNY